MTSYSEEIRTPIARLSFPALFKPKESKDGKKKYGCTLLFKKPGNLDNLYAIANAAAVAEWGEKAKDMIKNGVIKSPFLDGDGPQGMSKKNGTRYPGYEGHLFIRLSSGEDRPPHIVGPNPAIPAKAEEVYAGCYVYAIIKAYTWENPQNGRGVSFGLSMLQKARDGEKLGGSESDPTKAFDVIVDEGEAPAETKNGSGAAGFFA